ncbi:MULTISPECIES: hypothetical protein [unclassified Adlercreutzia]|uniref:hypothetical protein n=1 Tax=unclassified Adlercreutzia TaxID=2636013 RepID=UPI0013ED4C2F|nr:MULTISPECIES: hypothetical protein [unclassified Adlercreutzia]
MPTKENDIKGTEPCIIAYFDILGYKDFLKSNDNDEFALLSSIDEEFFKLNQLNKNKGLAPIGLRTKTFSDNVVLAIKSTSDLEEKEPFDFLAALLCILQLRFLERHNLLIRGSLVFGDILVNESMAFGKGLIDAVAAENERSKFPRILIDESVAKKLGHNMSRLSFIRRDNDGEYYLDFFQAVGFYTENARNAGCLAKIRVNLEKRIRMYCKYSQNVKVDSTILARDRIISKHLWMVEKFNAYCNENGEVEHSVRYLPVLNKRLMKYELRVKS